MTDQSSGTGSDIPLKTLQFEPIMRDSISTVYQARTAAENSPGSPLFAVTITIASPIVLQNPGAVQALLDGMLASFELLSELPPDSGGSGDEEPIDLNAQILIEISLFSSDGPETAGVAVNVVVQTTTLVVSLPIGSDPVGGVAGEDLKYTVNAGLEDCWRAKPNKPFPATVTPSMSSGTMNNDKKTINVSKGHPGQLTGTEIKVRANAIAAMTYAIRGNFYLWRQNVQGT